MILVAAGCAGGPALQSSPPNVSPTIRPPGASAPPSVTASRAPSPLPSPAPSASIPPADLLLVSAFEDGTLVLVDPVAGEIARVAVGTAPWGVAVGPDGLAYVATAEGVAVVDVARRQRVDLIAYATASLSSQPNSGEYRAGGLGIAVSPDGRRAYVGVSRFPESGAIDVVDLDARSVIASVPAGIRQFDVVASEDGSEVYAINHDSFDITVIDTRSLEPRTLSAAPLGRHGELASWAKPHYAALTADGALLMAFKGVLLWQLDPHDGSAAQRPLRSSTHSQGVELTPDGARLLVVGDGPDDTSLAHPSLEIVDLSSDTSAVVALNGSHNDVVVSADGRRAFVTGGSSREGYPHPDVVTVVDLSTAAVTDSFAVPGNPLIIATWSGPAH